MRVPSLLVVFLCLLTVTFVWWVSTRGADFLTPPSEARLEEIRRESQASLPVKKLEQDAISVRVPVPEPDATVPIPDDITVPMDVGDVTTPPVLDTYSDRAPEGADELLALAAALEDQGHLQRALLASERVLDLAQSNPEQILTAINSVKRIRPSLPPWNADPDSALPVTIHVGTGSKFADILPDLLKSLSGDILNASSGLLKAGNKLNIGRSIQATEAATPVAIWITGGGKNSPSTDVLSFTTDNPGTLPEDIRKTVFNLIRGHLLKSSSYNPVPETLEDPRSALDSHISRLLWQEFGTLLNPKGPGDQ